MLHRFFDHPEDMPWWASVTWIVLGLAGPVLIVLAVIWVRDYENARTDDPPQLEEWLDRYREMQVDDR